MKSVLIIISILFFQLVSHGAPIVDVDNPENRIQRKTVHGVELIEVCLDGDCEVFPHEDAPLIGFRGTEQEWTDIFYTCSTYEDLNLFTTLTELVSAFVVPGALKGFGLVKGAKALIGVSITQGIVTQGVKGFSTAYPNISEQEVKMLETYQFGVQEESEKPYHETYEAIEKIRDMYALCSHDFVDLYTTAFYSRYRGVTPFSHLNRPSAEHLSVPRFSLESQAVPFSSEGDLKEDLELYLESIK